MYIINNKKVVIKELVVQRCRFLCFASYVENEKDVILFLKKYKDKNANNSAYAYVIGKRKENVYKTDHGEKRNSVGKNILNRINGKNITNIIVLINRYYQPYFTMEEAKLAESYTSIIDLVLNSCTLKKVNEQVIIGILLRPLNEVFLKELLDKNNIYFPTRNYYRGNLVYKIIIERNNPVLIELDNLIIKGIIYSYKILKD